MKECWYKRITSVVECYANLFILLKTLICFRYTNVLDYYLVENGVKFTFFYPYKNKRHPYFTDVFFIFFVGLHLSNRGLMVSIQLTWSSYLTLKEPSGMQVHKFWVILDIDSFSKNYLIFFRLLYSGFRHAHFSVVFVAGEDLQSLLIER